MSGASLFCGGRQWLPFFLVVVCALLVGLLFFASCSSLPDLVVVPPRIEGAYFVGNPKCAECHGEIARLFPGSVHSRFFKEEAGFREVSGCESCHGAGSKHVQAGGGKGVFIHNPGQNPQACLDCHQAQHAEFRLPQRHPVLEGQMNCVDCHDPHGREIFNLSGGLELAREGDPQCVLCHREQARPFVFGHEALRDGCVSCHRPHGSVHGKMLVQGDSHLCLRCHSQMQLDPAQVLMGKTDHSDFLQMGTCWTAGCHTAVHGSMVNPKLLY